MLPISLGILVVALALAYAAHSKPIVAVFWQFLVSMVIIKLGFFNLWLTLTWKRDESVRTTDRWIKDMKKAVLKRRQGRIKDHLKREQAKIDVKAKKDDGGGGGRARTASGSLSRGSSMLSRLTTAGLDLMKGGVGRIPARPKTSGANGVGHGNSTIPMMTTSTSTGGASTAGQIGFHGPRESAISDLTTLAPTSTAAGPDPSRSSATMRGGGGERLRFVGGSLGDIV